MKALQGFDHPRVMKYTDQVTEDTPSGIHFHVIMKHMPQVLCVLHCLYTLEMCYSS